jgi:hypothetical protein
MNNREAGGLLALLQAAHPRTKLEDATVDVWLSELRKLDHRIAETAVRSLVEGVRNWPSIADLGERVAAVREQAARERRDNERHEAERAFDEMPRPPLREIPAAVELIERWVSPPSPLPSAADGVCDECGRSGARYELGRFCVCRACAARRLVAGARAAHR